MTVTVAFLQERFSHFNRLIFEGKLPDVEIRLSRAKRFLGRLEYRRVRGSFSRVVRCDNFLIKISTYRDLSLDELDDVLIHEMIHYYIAYFNIKDSSAHGEVFRSMMHEINRRFARHITISYKDISAAQDRLSEIREHIVCISDMPGGELGVTVCAKSRVSKIKALLPRYYRLNACRWYISKDPFFNRFPKSISPKIYKADQALLHRALENSTELAVTGVWADMLRS